MLTSEKLDAVLERASKLVTPAPSEEKRLKAVSSKVLSLLDEAMSRLPPSAARPEVQIGGSYARGTWLKGNHDIDFFLLYPVEYAREALEGEAIKLAQKAVESHPVNMRFAEHPYVEAFVDQVRVNLVPCYKVLPGEWKSAADRSPYHTKYINSKLDDTLRLEARLFKKFMKATGTYGAEVKIHGFSGYVCEVLTIKFGSFRRTLEGLSSSKPQEVISLEEYDRDVAAAFKSPLVILDPVDTTRNLGAAISAKNVAKTVIQSRRFLASPKIGFFEPPKQRIANFSNPKTREILSRVAVVEFKTAKRSPDILWGQLKKSSGAVSNKLETIGFKVLRSSAATNEKSDSALLFLLLERELEELSYRKGPEYFRGEEVQNYISKNSRRALLTWIDEEGRLSSVFKRRERGLDAVSMLKDMLSKEKIGSAGLSFEIRREIGSRKPSVTWGDELVRKHKDRNWLISELSALVSEE